MKNDFKKARYGLTIFLSLLCIAALLVSTASFYFEPDIVITLACNSFVLLAIIILSITCITSKHGYNKACRKFSAYIINSRQQNANRSQRDAELAEQIKSMQESSAKGREQAIAEAYEQGKNAGIAQASEMLQEFNTFSPKTPTDIGPDEEALYNEYGEPVLIRRKVKKQPAAHIQAKQNTAQTEALALPSGESYNPDGLL